MKAVIAATAFATLVTAAAPGFAEEVQKPATVAAPEQPGTGPACPVDPSSLAIAHEILTLGFPPEKREQMFASVIDAIMAQARSNVQLQKFSDDKEFQAILDRSNLRMMEAMKASISAAIPDYFEAMARAYARDFSADDLNAILSFVKTPAGQHYLERSSQIVKDPDVALAGRRMTAQLMAKLPDIMAENIKDAEDYVAKKEKQAKASHAAHIS